MNQGSGRLMGQDRKRARAEEKVISKYENVAVAEKCTKNDKGENKIEKGYRQRSAGERHHYR